MIVSSGSPAMRNARSTIGPDWVRPIRIGCTISMPRSCAKATATTFAGCTFPRSGWMSPPATNTASPMSARPATANTTFLTASGTSAWRSCATQLSISATTPASFSGRRATPPSVATQMVADGGVCGRQLDPERRAGRWVAARFSGRTPSPPLNMSAPCSAGPTGGMRPWPVGSRRRISARRPRALYGMTFPRRPLASKEAATTVTI